MTGRAALPRPATRRPSPRSAAAPGHRARATPPAGTATSSPSTTSASASAPASPACSARTAPARRRCSTCWPASSRRPPARSASSAAGPHRDPSVYRQIGLVPEREAVYPFLTGLEYVRFNARLQGMPNADRAARAAIARVGLEDAAGPPDRDVLQGHAPAGQGRRRARPRPPGPPARRAVQRHGPAPAAGHDGSAGRDGRAPAGRSSSRRTSSRRSSGSAPTSWSWSPAAWPPRATSARSGPS